METQKWNVDLDAIALSTTNEMFRSTQEVSNDALQDLTNSILQFGVIQPVLLRPHPENPGSYILISGERRYRASKLAGKSDIPAYIKEVNDETALVLQITENMQRENVHPLNEAKGYKIILENDKTITTTELASRFAKSETYILQRLKLNDLVKEAKKDFYNNKMNIGHALLLARLTPQHQKEAIEEIINYKGGYGTVGELQEFVERNIMNNLSKAPFDLIDPDLYKKAGACTHCPKRSGASPLLFADIKEKDKCFDRNCFMTKCERFVVNQTREVVETQPDIVFLTDNFQPHQDVLDILTEHKIKPLREYNEFSEHSQGGAKVKGLWISGSKAGHIATIYLKNKTSELSGSETENEKTMISKIQQRMIRGRELDHEKVYEKILEGLKNHATQKKGYSKRLMADEEILLWYIIFDKAGYQLKRELMKFIGLTKEDPEKMYSCLKKLKPEERAFILRKVMLDQYGGNYPESNYGFIIKKIAQGYGDIEIALFEKDQAAIRNKREERAKERIKLLHKTKTELKK